MLQFFALDVEYLQLLTPHTPAECVLRLKTTVDTGWKAYLFNRKKPVYGRVNESGFLLVKRIGYKNSFQTTLAAKMETASEGTVIHAKLGASPFVRIFMFVWLGFSVMFCNVFIIMALCGCHDSVAFILAFAMPVFGIGLVKVGRYFARNEARYLTDFVISTLDARPL